MHAKMMLAWMVYATTMLYCMEIVSSFAENDGGKLLLCKIWIFNAKRVVLVEALNGSQ